MWGVPHYNLVDIKEAELKNPIVTVTPVPVIDKFDIEISILPTNIAYFSLYDVWGRHVKQEVIKSQQIKLERCNVLSGVYFGEVTSAGKTLGKGRLIME